MEIGFSCLMLKLDPGAIMKLLWAQGPWVKDSDLGRSAHAAHTEQGTWPRPV